MSFECNVVKKSLGLSSCNKIPGLIRGMITTPLTFSLTEAQALLSAQWQNAILAASGSRIHIWPNFVAAPENVSEADVYEDGPLGIVHVRDGNYRFRFFIKESLCLHKKMYTHRSTSGRAFLFDVNNQIIGTLDSDGNVRGFTYQLLNTEKFIFSDGSVATKSPIFMAFADNRELDQNGVIFDASFINTLDRLTDVEITVVSAVDDEIVVTVAVECDGSAVNGLVLADFILLDADGVAQTISGVAEDDGTYTLSGTGLVSGTIKLAAPADLSIQAYESYATTVTVAS